MPAARGQPQMWGTKGFYQTCLVLSSPIQKPARCTGGLTHWDSSCPLPPEQGAPHHPSIAPPRAGFTPDPAVPPPILLLCSPCPASLAEGDVFSTVVYAHPFAPLSAGL